MTEESVLDSLPRQAQALEPTQPYPPVGIKDFFSRVDKKLVRKSNHSPPSIVEVKTTWSFTSSPPYVFHCCA
jgi:hypothetical protein